MPLLSALIYILIFGNEIYFRPSSLALSNAAKDGVIASGGECADFGILTTPQLHYMVACKNTKEKYGTTSENGYYEKISKAFIAALGEVSHIDISIYIRA